ncbi:PCI domain-containing protein [Drepanopeziza brunnea f. sp. 'multigermtubi' MB_m1]|uniref:PCI domain-containing protein n=1 Tax=Marssonina brunnea f. sp. multigermtubi (strain MB_m1) TaxID=1072389 RepID=K1WLM8_MARBU|nr:PCI domain-containing protein [Drepanopeziza brunnea f. sp. 'multigermtubi' MB_m1]EKD18620.1 PCI domain-containing protein [Drepanopeziza brunnea f. sp. 'multigermtubi' MB_m1]
MTVVDHFLSSIFQFLKAKDGVQLRLWFQVEPPLPQEYTQLSQELKASWIDSKKLEQYIENALPFNDDDLSEDGGAWPGFLAFMQSYLEFWRDVKFEDLLATHLQLSALIISCNTAMSNATYGIIMLPTAMQLCKALAQLAVMLDGMPHLTQKMAQVKDVEAGEKKTLVESTAETIQRAFTLCLNERTPSKNGIGRDGKPEGKKIGIYSFANMVLKLLFKRRAILIHLLSANMILGRFPSQAFANRPEADIVAKFMPIANAIRKGNMVAFKHALGPEAGNEKWFFRHGVYLQLLHRCEVLVWRTLARRVFLLTYTFPWDPDSKKAPTLSLADMVAATQFCQKLLEGWRRPADSLAFMQSGRKHVNSQFMKTPDFVPPPEGPKLLHAGRGMIFGNKVPDLINVESILASLVQQGLLRGFISHTQGKFAIIGSKQKGGPLPAGFPPVWEVLKARAESENRTEECPGWVQRAKDLNLGGVVNLAGARPAGENS